jgi:2,4-dienoyl-CoA reductase (NADPH2)
MAAFYAARAKGGVGLIVTGGISPNAAGRVTFGAAKMSTIGEAHHHKIVTEAVHQNGGKIAMQILHAGRYSYHFYPVSASAIKSPIAWYKPTALTSAQVQQTIDDYVKAAVLARSAGYDGVEVMGSEGYLINQFLVEKTNKRTDEWGGSYANRMRLPVEIVKRMRAAVGKDFIIIYRLSMLDLVEGGSSWEEIVELAKAIEAAGASIINTGIGWHEARVPTIATLVPRGAFSWVTHKMKSEVSIPLCTTNRINMPDTAENILQTGHADLVSMARPFLADPELPRKAFEGRVDEINTCIGCNQACLDNTFRGQRASCLVNPLSGYELKLVLTPVEAGKKQLIAVVGAGPAGLAFATSAAQRGHAVTLFDKDAEVGGQFNMAKLVPGKEEFYETIRYFKRQLTLAGVTLKLGKSATVDDLTSFDSIVIATGVLPRKVKIPNNSTDGKVVVLSYIDVLRHKKPVGSRVAVIGAGGIGFDIADFITHSHTGHSPETFNGPASHVDSQQVGEFLHTWGVDDTMQSRGGLMKPVDAPPPRKVYLLQRKEGKVGATLGKTTGWIHRSTLKKRDVVEMGGCTYVEINDEGLVIEKKGVRTTLAVDTVVLCAGQVPLVELREPLIKAGKRVFTIGGALEAGELDAKRAIDQGTRLAAVVETAKDGEVFNAPVDFMPRVMKTMQKLLGRS